MMADSNVFIKFDPKKISEVASDLELLHKRITKSLENIVKKSNNLTNSWLGDTSLVFMDKVQELNTQGEEIAKVLISFSYDLANASGIYKTGEIQAKNKAESLPTEGVFLI